MKNLKSLFKRIFGIETLGVRYNQQKQGYERI